MNQATPIQRDMTVPFQPLPEGVAGQSGAALTGVADQIGDFAVAQQKAQDQKDLVQARLAATKQLDALSDQFRTDQDPDTMAQRYSAAADQIGKTVGGNLSGPAATAFADDYSMMSDSRVRTIKDIAFGRQTEQANSAFDDTLETSARAAAYSGNDAERASNIATVQKGAQGLVDTGMMSAETAQKKIQDFRERLSLYDGKRDVFLNPAQAVTNLAKPDYLPDLDPLSRVELQNSADAAVRERAREAAQAREQAKMEAEFAASDLQDVVSSGLPVAQSVIDQAKATAAASGDPHALNRVAGLLRAQGFSDALRGAPPREVDAGIAALTAQADKDGANVAMATALTAARKFKENMNAGLASDPLMWGAQQGVVALQPLALNGSDAPAAFANRVQQSQQLSQRYGVPVSPLTQAETETLKSQLSSTADPNTRLRVLQTVVNGFGANSAPILSRIGAADPALARAGALVASGNSYASAARDILAGTSLLSDKSNSSLRPTAQAETNANVPGMMSAFAMIPDMRGPVVESAAALYAARAARQGLSGAQAGDKGSDLYAQSLQEAAGARFDGAGEQWGGLAKITRNGMFSGGNYWVQVPASVKADGFEDVVHNLDASDLARASVTGAAPKWQGGDAPADLTRHTWLVSGGNGVYALSATNPGTGSITPVLDKTGQPFRFKFDTALVSMQARLHGGQ